MKNLGIQSDLSLIKTSGDVFVDKPLHQLSGWGLFVAEIDDRMLCGEIDLAVHSMKDIPTKRPKELVIAAVLKRDSPYDILVSRDGSDLDSLEKGAVVGTSSMRRSAQLKRARPDIHVASLRGNLQTRLGKLKRGDYDAIVLAEAGVERMGCKLKYSVLSPDMFVPSANQGTIAVVARKGSKAEKCAGSIDDRATRLETTIEREIMETVGGGCVVPVGIHAELQAESVRVVAEVLSLDGSRFVRVDESIPPTCSTEMTNDLGRRLLNMGGRSLVDEAVKAFGKR